MYRHEWLETGASSELQSGMCCSYIVIVVLAATTFLAVSSVQSTTTKEPQEATNRGYVS